MPVAFLLHHRADLDWVRRVHGVNVQVIAHEDYLPALLGEAIPCFFEYESKVSNADVVINFLSHNWHRDELGNDLYVEGGLSIAEVFSTGLWITIAGICREYFALKHWADKYDCLYVSCNEPPGFLNAAKKFGVRVQIYDPGHGQPSPLQSFTERVLAHVLRTDWRASFLRQLQRPFRGLLRNQVLALTNWTLVNVADRRSGWLLENSRWPWKGVYFHSSPYKYLVAAERRVPRDFVPAFSPGNLGEVLGRIDARWERSLLELLSETMSTRYHRHRVDYVKLVAIYTEMLDFYRPAELVIPSETYDPSLAAAHLARERGVSISWLVDGYPIVDIPKRIGRASLGPTMFDRVYAMACQHSLRLRKTSALPQELVTIFPPLLNRHTSPIETTKRFDAIIMTWIPNDLGLTGRNGTRPMILLDALRVATEAGLQKLAIKIKEPSEKAWLLPILQKAGYLDQVAILEGPFANHVARARCVIGGISSAVGEAAYHNIPYYIYEPVPNGYTSEQIASANVIIAGGVARTPAELSQLLKQPAGSVKRDRSLLFGTECRDDNWSWDQTRELYTDWAALWADRSGIKEALQWRGFPLWWASNLIAKDTGVDYAWYQELHNRLRGLSAKRFQPRADIAIYLGMLASLARDLAKWALLRLLPPATQVRGERVWFHSLEYNLLDIGSGLCDRMYDQVHLEDEEHGFASAFIVRLTLKKTDFLHPFLWRKKVASLADRLQRDVEILDRHLHIFDIIQIYLSLMRSYYGFRKFIRPFCHRGIRIGHAEFADILLCEFQKSFMVALPWSLSYAAMFERWLQKDPGDKTLVSYGETLAPIRSVYFVTRRNSPGHRWITIQHATNYRNKMQFYHRFSEFNKIELGDKRATSPMPDYYFCHGPQSANILAEFYPPERIRTIGCLKYDRLFRLYGTSKRTRPRTISERLLLLAPSVGDEEIILRMFAGVKGLAGWRVVFSKHPAVSQDHITEIVRRNQIAIDIEFHPEKTTIQLVEDASLVVCSYSSIALESCFIGVPSVRVLNPEQPPMVEDEPGIKYVTNQHDLLRIISELADGKVIAGMPAEIFNTLDRYFLHFDGLTSWRFWTQLSQLPDLPRRQLRH